jgi:hypothetical protein
MGRNRGAKVYHAAIIGKAIIKISCDADNKRKVCRFFRKRIKRNINVITIANLSASLIVL